MARPVPPQLEAICQVAPVEAQPVIRRLAALEARDELTADEMHELNALRMVLNRWPEINGALAHAYITET